MPATISRLAIGLALSGSLFAGVLSGPGATAAQSSCDPAYTNYCVPPVWEVGDLDCQWFYDQGISGILLVDPTNDPHGLDGWNYVDDGIGCEGQWSE